MLINNPQFIGLLGNLFFIFLGLSILMIIKIIFFDRSSPRSVATWMTILLFVPVIGFFIYLCFGDTYYARRKFAIKNVTDQELATIKEQALEDISRERITPENEEGLRFARAMLETSGTPYSNNNNMRMYNKRGSFFDDLFSDLKNAKKFIHAEYYSVGTDGVAEEFFKILTEKAKSGVEVRLMLDAIGYKFSQRKYIRDLKRAGGEFALFHKTITVLLSPKKQNRNHRKLMVIDGEIGYVSGFDIKDTYIKDEDPAYERDSGVRVEGQSVVTMSIRFFMDWGYATKVQLDAKSPDSEKYFPLYEEKNYGQDVVQLVSGGPDTKNSPVELQCLRLINVAKSTLFIRAQYLIPSSDVQKALILSACSGVDVRIIMPEKPKRRFVYWISVMNAGELLQNGVRIYRYKDSLDHSKTIVADGEFCSIGSANLDQRSMRLSFESNAMIYSKTMGKDMNDAFIEDLANCKEYTLEEFNGLTRFQNFKISVMRLLGPIA